MRMSRRIRPNTITLYNYTGSNAGVASYQRTVIEHVYLDEAYQQKLGMRGIQTEDKALMILDLSDFEATSSRTFIAADSWKGLTPEQKALHFTFQPQNDFFVKGVAAETLPGTTKAAMEGKYRCFTVSSAEAPASSSAGATQMEVTSL